MSYRSQMLLVCVASLRLQPFKPVRLRNEKIHQLTTTAATAGATLNKLHYPDQTIKKRYSSVFRTGKHLQVKISFVYREHRTTEMF